MCVGGGSVPLILYKHKQKAIYYSTVLLILHMYYSCRDAVMDQKDPNDVSGLLKLHLRENHILTPSTSQLVQNAMAGTYSVESTVSNLCYNSNSSTCLQFLLFATLCSCIPPPPPPAPPPPLPPQSAGVQELISCCPPRELKVLFSIVTFMSELVSDPWKTKNKMTPHTLGIACGLSLFPKLDPGQATQVLEYLIKHTDELQSLVPA